MNLPTRILVPVDFSDCSLDAVDHAVNLAESFAASVDLLHVWQPPVSMGPEDPLRADSGIVPLVDFARSESGQALTALVARFEPHTRVPVQGRFEIGRPTEVILGLLEREHYDLVVMGTHGRSGISHLLLGSVAEQVVRLAPCPVLTVRRRPGQMRTGDSEPAAAQPSADPAGDPATPAPRAGR